MKITKSIVILLSLALLTAGPAHSMERATKTSGTLKASCLVRISSDPTFLTLDFELLDALVHSSGVGGKAVRDVLGISPDEVDNLIDLEDVQYLDSATLQPTRSIKRTRPPGDMYGEEMMMEDEVMGPAKSSAALAPSKPKSPSETTTAYQNRIRAEAAARARARISAASRTASPGTPSFATEEAILIRLDVDLGESQAKPAAEEFLDAVIENLRSSLLKAFEDYRHRFYGHLEVANEEAMQTEKDLRDKQERLRAISGSRVLDRNVILRDISELRGKIELIEMEQASEVVIIDLTAKQIAKIRRETEQQIANDNIAKELEDLLGVQAANLQRVEQLHKAGTASTAEVAEARAKLARSRIELAQRREQLNKSVGGNLIESLNAKLAESSIQRAQAKAYLSTYQRQFREAEDLLEKADDYDLLLLKAEIAKQNLRDVLVWRDGLSRRMRMLLVPSVSVFGGE